jgi:ABC-type dipeptide/oligopeptide/nickel transport system permease subunit
MSTPMGSVMIRGQATRPRRGFRGSQLAVVWRTFKRDRVAVVSAVVITIAGLAALGAPWIAPYSPYEGDGVLRLNPIGTPGHPLGLDGQGRDILSRLIWGGRVSIASGVLPVAVAALISLVLGVTAGFYQGIIGGVIMRVMDVFIAFPIVLLAAAIAGVMGPGMLNVMLSMVIVIVPYVTRTVYSATVEIRRLEFVEAACAAGARNVNILFGQILPNVLSPLLVYSTTIVGVMITLAAGLSFLGLGVQPPEPDWGIMTSDGRVVLDIAPHVATIPGLAIVIITLAFNLVGDGLRDALDPHLRVR